MFEPLKRQAFRAFFQPSRIVLGIVPIQNSRRVNVITLCFNMHASYRPRMMAFAVQEKSYSRTLFEYASECILAVPGEDIANETLYCGEETGREVNKVEECNFQLCKSSRISVPGLKQAIANIQVRITNKVVSGDHLTVLGEVLEYSVNTKKKERNLVSVGPQHNGYTVIVQKGIHRIAVIDPSTT